MTGSRKPRGPYRKSIERRERILDAALEAFAELGDRGTSLQEIADRVGVTHPALMYYFSSREELLLAALARRDILDTELAKEEGNGPGLLASIRHNMEQPGLVKLYLALMSAAADPGHHGHEFFTERYSRLVSVFERGIAVRQREGQVRGDEQADDMARLFMAVMDGLWMQWLYDPSMDITASMESFMRMCAGPEASGREADAAVSEAEARQED